MQKLFYDRRIIVVAASLMAALAGVALCAEPQSGDRLAGLAQRLAGAEVEGSTGGSRRAGTSGTQGAEHGLGSAQSRGTRGDESAADPGLRPGLGEGGATAATDNEQRSISGAVREPTDSSPWASDTGDAVGGASRRTSGGAASGGGGTSGGASGGGWVLDTLTALGVVLGLIFLVRAVGRRWWPSRMAKTASASVLEVLARVAVAPRSHVLLLKLGQRILVVGESPAGMSALANVEEAEEVADLLEAVQRTSPHSASKSFAQLFGRFSGEYERGRRAEDGTDEGEITVDRTREGVSALLGRLRRFGAGSQSGAGK